MKKSILLDVDEVICFPGFLKACNDFLNTNYEIDDFDTYYLDEQIIPKDRWDEFILFLGKRNVYDDAVLLPDAFDVINDIPLEVEGQSVIYKIYVYKQALVSLNSSITFKFITNESVQ